MRTNLTMTLCLLITGYLWGLENKEGKEIIWAPHARLTLFSEREIENKLLKNIASHVADANIFDKIHSQLSQSNDKELLIKAHLIISSKAWGLRFLNIWVRFIRLPLVVAFAITYLVQALQSRTTSEMIANEMRFMHTIIAHLVLDKLSGTFIETDDIILERLSYLMLNVDKRLHDLGVTSLASNETNI
jgi:hypothetical protein